MREWEIGAVENIHGALPYIRFAPILALVGVGVNRIGKVDWYFRHWSKGNLKQVEEFAIQYAIQKTATATYVFNQLENKSSA